MESTTDFVLEITNYTVRSLHPADAGAMQTFFERCNDFNLLVDGEDVSPTAGQDIFLEAPPGFPQEDKFMFGVYDRDG